MRASAKIHRWPESRRRSEDEDDGDRGAATGADARRRRRRTRIADLTERELEILLAVARGLSNAEIADAMFISHAKTHVSRLLMKLGARDRAQLVTIAYESGICVPGAK